MTKQEKEKAAELWNKLADYLNGLDSDGYIIEHAEWRLDVHEEWDGNSPFVKKRPGRGINVSARFVDPNWK